MNLLKELKDAMKYVDVDVQYIYEEGMTFNEFEDSVLDRIAEIEVIYYSNAIAYLKEEDPSLKNSLQIAKNMGYDLGSLNSELLATLLKQENEKDMWFEINDVVEDLFNQYQEFLDEEED